MGGQVVSGPGRWEALTSQWVAEVIVDRVDAPATRGSGYRVRDDLVLTAAHVVADAAGVTLRFDAEQPGEWSAPGTIAWCDPAADVALVRLDRVDGVAVLPARFGRLTATPQRVQAHVVGFPRWKLRQVSGGGVVREAHHAVGSIAGLSNPKSQTLEIRVDPPGEDPKPGVSPWEAMSGAAVWVDGCVVGVVSSHYRREGLGFLTAVRLASCFSGPDGPGAVLGLGAEPLVDVPAEDKAPHRVLGHLPMRAAHYQPRRELAGRIHESKATTSVLSGLGGVGKTQLAARYAQDRADDGHLVIWVDASSPEAIESRFAEAGAAYAGADPAQPAQAAERFLSWLADTSQPWLIVLDDLPDVRALGELRPPADVATGRTLITTRRRDRALAGGDGEFVEIREFDPGDAEQYLRGALDAHLADDVTGVAADLGFLPLALGQAAAFMNDLDVPCGGYRKRFADRRKRLPDLLPETNALPDGYRQTVAVTWSLSIEAVDRERPAGLARPLLKLSAVLDPGGIPDQVFFSDAALNWLGYQRTPDADTLAGLDPDTVHDALRKLHVFNLLSYEAGLVRVHNLVQRTVQDQYEAAELGEVAWAAADALLSGWLVPGRHDLMRANTRVLARDRIDDLWHEYGPHPVLINYGMDLGQTGQVRAAIDHFTRLAEISEQRLGRDHDATRGLRGNIGSWQTRAGDTSSIHDLEQLVAEKSRDYGRDHPSTLFTRHNLALAYMQVGAFEQALSEMEQVLVVRRRLRMYGPDHELTLTTWHNLAFIRGESGDAAGAAAEFETIVAETIRMVGTEHPDALSAQHEHARWRNISGDHATAKAIFASVIAARIELLGPTHPDTLLSQEGLAFALKSLGDEDAARALLDEVRDHQEQVLDPDNPDLLFKPFYEAVERLDSGDGDALDELTRRFEDLLRTFGGGHRYVQLAAQALAFYRQKAGETDVNPMVVLAQGLVKVLPPDDPLRDFYEQVLDRRPDESAPGN
ncbi:tetratricopeptide repeat protein [Actinoplanes sp. HUAS TT8]|uniref:tetratricopeptide repeat protein n=1 Tax=Actinoplanes sp. HUAS TT8 TaxID=3447453 RepID=UPI003F525279